MTKAQWTVKHREERRTARKTAKLAAWIIWARNFSFLKAIEKEIEPILEEKRKAEKFMNSGSLSLLENSPELYGCKPNSLEIHKVASPGKSCDCELDDTSARLVYCASRHDSPETPLTKEIN